MRGGWEEGIGRAKTQSVVKNDHPPPTIQQLTWAQLRLPSHALSAVMESVASSTDFHSHQPRDTAVSQLWSRHC